MKVTLPVLALVAHAAAADAEPAVASSYPVPDVSAEWALAEPIAAPPAGESPWTVRIAAGTYAPIADTAALVLVEVDRQLRFAGGRVGVAASVGYLQTCAGVAPHQTLRMFPLFAGLVYRTPALGFAVAPLVLSAKLGPAYQAWLRDDARGAKLGWRGALGVAVRLDQIDPDAQRRLAQNAGIDHTAISLAMTYFGVDGFPRTMTWSLGLELDF